MIYRSQSLVICWLDTSYIHGSGVHIPKETGSGFLVCLYQAKTFVLGGNCWHVTSARLGVELVNLSIQDFSVISWLRTPLYLTTASLSSGWLLSGLVSHVLFVTKSKMVSDWLKNFRIPWFGCVLSCVPPLLLRPQPFSEILESSACNIIRVFFLFFFPFLFSAFCCQEERCVLHTALLFSYRFIICCRCAPAGS